MAMWKFFGCALVCLLMAGLGTGNIVLIGKNITKSFSDVEASFTPPVKGSGECGILYLADPVDACTPLMNRVVEGFKSPFALIARGGCPFDEKVRGAQAVGFKAAVIYDDEDGRDLVAMAGTPEGIKISAVFISKAAGEMLKKYTGHIDMEFWIIPNFENSAWSIMAVSFISLLAMSSMLAMCFFVRKHVQHERNIPSQPSQVQEFHGMSRRSVRAIPSLMFTTVLEDNCTSRTCAVCLEDYNAGEKLRVLPCRHKFHAVCVDAWLTAWRTFCPVCKQDARRTSTGNLHASESTPLLSSGASSPSSATGFLSRHSSFATSAAIPIVLPPNWSPSASRTSSLSSASHIVNSYKSYTNSTSVCIPRSSADPRNLSLWPPVSHHVSSRSAGLPVSSPFNSVYMCPYNPTSSNASASYLVGSSGRHSYLRHCESGASLSALTSAQTLPGC